MNIMIITYQGEITGSTNSIAYLSKGLAERGHTVIVALRKESLLYKMLEGSKAIRVPMSFTGKFDRKNVRQIAEAVKKYNIQLINAQSSRDRYTTIWAKWWYRLPVKIYHTRRQPPKSIGGPQYYFYRKITEKIIVVSEELKRIFMSKGFPENHLKVIHNGIPPGRYEEWSEERVQAIRTEYGLDNEKVVIGSISRIKRQQQIVDAFVQLNDPDIRLLFVGVTHDDLSLDKVPDHLKERITIVGKVPIADSLNWYRVFDINILASVTDGFGLVLLEAMAMECPVIATDFGGIKDVVVHEENGLLFNDGNIQELVKQIQRVRTDKSLKGRLIKNGLKTAYETFTIENTINGYERFFKEELGEN